MKLFRTTKLGKRFLTLLLAFVMCMGMLPGNALAAVNRSPHTFKWYYGVVYVDSNKKVVEAAYTSGSRNEDCPTWSSHSATGYVAHALPYPTIKSVGTQLCGKTPKGWYMNSSVALSKGETLNYYTTWTGNIGQAIHDGQVIWYVLEKQTTYDYSITYNLNSGKYNGSTANQSQSANNQTATSYTFTGITPTRDGYTFAGWSDNLTVTSNNPTKTVTAQWTPIVTNVKLTYVDRGMTYKEETYTKGANATIVTCTNTRPGYRFLGWNTSSSATTADYEAGDGITMGADLTLYAIWQTTNVEPSYNVTFKKTFGGSLEEIPEDFSIQWDVVCGTYKASKTLTYGNADSIDEDTKTVSWKVPHFYGLGANNTATVTENCDVPGYTYQAICGQGAVNGHVISGIPIASMASGATRSVLNAYTPVLTYSYKLDYDANVSLGESVTVPKMQVVQSISDTTHEFEISKTEPSRMGYEFIGWSTDQNATAAQYQPGSKITLTGTEGTWSITTLYAVWAEHHTFGLTYNANGKGATIDGTATSRQFTTTSIRTEDYFIVQDFTPVREGYNFLGWSEDRDAKTATIHAGEKISLTVENPRATIYAIWECAHDHDDDGLCTDPDCNHDDDCCPKHYTVTWIDGYDGTELQSLKVRSDSTSTITQDIYPELPTHEDKDFVTWVIGTPDEDGNYTITATWKDKEEEPGTFTVTWIDGYDDTEITSETFEDGTVITEENYPEYPIHDDKVFDKWIVTGPDEDGNITITATWKDKEETPDKYKVIWIDEYDGEELGSAEFEIGVSVSEDQYPNVPSREDKEFDNWVVGEPDEDGTIVIKATWKDKEKDPEPGTHTITWVDGYDNSEIDSKEVEDGSTVPETEYPTVPTHDDKVFDKWVVGEPDEDGNITITATWKDKDKDPEPSTHLVIWVDGYDNTTITSREVKDGVTVPESEYPDVPGHRDSRFVGWSVGKPDENGNIIITANWSRNTGGGGRPGGSGGNGGGGNSGGGSTGGGVVDIQDPSVPLASAPGLNDTDHFAYIIGYVDGTVRPEAYISRAEVATIFFRLMTEEFRSANWSTQNNFSDVAGGSWYNNAVSTGTTAGIIRGYADGSFAPDANITRAEFAAIASRFLSDETAVGSSFTDIGGHWAEDDINRAVTAGWIRGRGDNRFAPDDYITRAEVMTLVNRMLDRVGDTEAMLDDMVVWSDNMDENVWYYADVQEATNGHEYERDELGIRETWTKLTENRDWSELEK